jgi:hypothetical protein
MIEYLMDNEPMVLPSAPLGQRGGRAESKPLF